MHEQLARDRGAITDCQSLCIEGSGDGLFKITLTAHGYTMIAKGMQQEHVAHLRHEKVIYCQLRPIPGKYVQFVLGV